MRLDLLHHDDDFVAVYKPAGLLVHRTRLDAGETRFCVQTLRDQLGVEVFPCHRLDKPTGGILLFALNKPALRQAQEEFATKRACKEYLAVVRGWIPPAGRIDYPLRYEKDSYDARAPAADQAAVTDYERLSKAEVNEPVGRYSTARYSLVRLLPETGRKHQLRRHLAHVRHPIVGDTRHGDGAQNRFFREHFGCHRLLLVATRLGFAQNSPLAFIQIETAPDLDFCRVAEEVSPAFACSSGSKRSATLGNAQVPGART